MDSKKEIVFIVNPISGTHSKEFILHQIEKRLDHSLYNYTIRKTEYAGPIPVALCLGSDGRIIGVLTGPNQETPRYLRMLEKKGFFERWNGMTLEEAAERQVDAVTRATYSSDAILHGVRQAAKYHFEAAKRKHSSAGNDWNGLLLSAVVLLSAAIYLLCDFRRRLKRETSSCSCCKN